MRDAKVIIAYVNDSQVATKTLEAMADERAYGVTVVGAGRIDLGPNRIDVEVLQEIREIGGEQYLWEFARFTKDELEESRKPPPPTVSY